MLLIVNRGLYAISKNCFCPFVGFTIITLITIILRDMIAMIEAAIITIRETPKGVFPE